MRPAGAFQSLLLAAALTLSAPWVAGAVALAVDLDPSTAAIESDANLSLGATLVLAIRIQDVSADAPLNAFELTLSFDSAVLGILDAQPGDFLAPPIETIQRELTPDVALAFATLGPGAVSGSGLLALIAVQGAALGTSALTLHDVLLSAPFGEPIAVDSLANATLHVVPEPATSALVATGCARLALRRRRRPIPR